MKIQNRPVCFGITVAFFLFLVMFFGSRVRSSALSGTARDFPVTVDTRLAGKTHRVTFVYHSYEQQVDPMFSAGTIEICVGDSVEFCNGLPNPIVAFDARRSDWTTGSLLPGECRVVGPFSAQGAVDVSTFDQVGGNWRRSYYPNRIWVIDCPEKGQTEPPGKPNGPDEKKDQPNQTAPARGQDEKKDQDKKKTGQKTSEQTPARSIRVTYTRDWQPGDEVSFSFSGNVYGPSGERQTQDDYNGDFVGIVDSQGNKTEIPWKKVIRYKVPEAATSVTASLMKPDRTVITTANIPVHPKGTLLPIQLPPKITGNSVAYPVSQIGQPYTIYAPNGGFSGDANKIKLRTTNKIDNATTESNAVAASPHSALFNPQVKEPGSYEYAVIDEGRLQDSFDVSAVGVKLDTSRAYRVNQQGTLAIIVALPPQADAQKKLFSENFQVTIEMETPSVLAFSNGQNPVVWSLQKSEVAKHQARKEFSVRAGAPGTFTITARAKTPQCNNPSVSKAGTGTSVAANPVSPGTTPQAAPGPLDKQVVHVEGSPGGGNGLWLVKIKLQSGKIINIFISSSDKPALKFCNWIKIKKSHDEKGDTYVDSYDMTEDPNKKPPPPPKPTPKPTPVTPPTTGGKGPGTTTEPPPCKEGDIRNKKEETKSFEYIDDDAQVSFSMDSTSSDGVNAALGMADFWKTAAKVVKGITDRLPGSGGGAVAVGLLTDYLDKGGDILNAVAKGKIAKLNEGVSMQLAVTSYKVTVTCITFEICENGKWVTKKVLVNPPPTKSIYFASRRAHLGDAERDKIEDSSRPQFLDAAKVDQWAKDFLKGELDKLKKAKLDYEEFVKNCK